LFVDLSNEFEAWLIKKGKNTYLQDEDPFKLRVMACFRQLRLGGPLHKHREGYGLVTTVFGFFNFSLEWLWDIRTQHVKMPRTKEEIDHVENPISMTSIIARNKKKNISSPIHFERFLGSVDAGCVAKSDYVNEWFGSSAPAASKAFKKETIASCRTPDGKGSDIFDVDDDETQLLLDDRLPQLLSPQDLPEVATISQSS
jgi:hypothetical protein